MEQLRYECSLWTIKRQDGVVIRVTDHDVDIEYNGKTYLSSGALDPSEAGQKSGLNSLDMDVLGAIDNDIFLESEILCGMFENAQIEHIRYDWKRSKTIMTVFTGRIGSIRHSNSQFQFDLCSSFDKIGGVYGRSYQKTCHARFCDKACGLNAKDFETRTKLIRVEGQLIYVEKCSDPERFVHGILTFCERVGETANCGIEQVSQHAEELQIKIRSPLRLFPKSGEAIALLAGCDKRFESCIGFDNAVNFQGFPHMPGEVILNENAQNAKPSNS